MASQRDIRRRIGSVKNIKQITRAMQFVAASKLKRAQDATLAARPYSEKLDEVLADLAAVLDGDDHPLLATPESTKRLIVLITTDRPLSGPLNTNIVRFVARDIIDDTLVRKATISGVVPLILPGLSQAPAVLRTVLGPRFLGSRPLMVPSYDVTAEDFQPTQYWRGPAWFNMTWLVIRGLRTHGRDREADALSANLRALALEHQFPEYVDPWTGAPHGTRNFSWTAALALDLAAFHADRR